MLKLIASIGSFVPSLFGFNLSFKAAKIAGFITLVILLVVALSLGKLAYDKSVVNKHEVAREAAATEAREEAADQRVADLVNNSRSEEGLLNVIENAPPPVAGQPAGLSPAAVALNCERLRRLGRVPPACRRVGGN